MTQNLKHLTAGAAFPPLLSTLDSISARLLPQRSPGLYSSTFVSLALRTPIQNTTQTHMISCLLTLLRRTKSPTRKRPHPPPIPTPFLYGRRRGRHLSRQQMFPPGFRRAEGLNPCFLAPTSSALVFSKMNQTDGSIQATTMKNGSNPATEIGKFFFFFEITPAFTSQ